MPAGLDIDHAADVQRYRADTMRRHMAEMVGLITGYPPEASIYFNGVTWLDRDANTRYRLYRHYTQNDLEDLPTTWGGYDKLALRAHYFANAGKPYVAMSGKFHTSWGEFGGFKHPDALRFEAASMVSYGAACNFGDHLHPSGEEVLARVRKPHFSRTYGAYCGHLNTPYGPDDAAHPEAAHGEVLLDAQ